MSVVCEWKLLTGLCGCLALSAFVLMLFFFFISLGEEQRARQTADLRADFFFPHILFAAVVAVLFFFSFF